MNDCVDVIIEIHVIIINQSSSVGVRGSLGLFHDGWTVLEYYRLRGKVEGTLMQRKLAKIT